MLRNGRTRICPTKSLGGRALALAMIENQTGILDRLTGGAPLQTVLDSLVMAIESRCDGMLGSALLLSDDGRASHAAAPSLPRAYVDAIDGIKIGPAAGSCGTAMYLGTPVISADISSDARWRDYRKAALDHGLRACWSWPIVSHGGVLGAFGLYGREPRYPHPRERNLVEVGVQLAAIAIGTARPRSLASSPGARRAKLSARELQVMNLIVRGESVKRIASGLRMAASTVYTHRARIFEKLGIDSNVLLVRYAVDQA